MDIQNNVSKLLDERLKKRLLLVILCLAYPAYAVHSCITSPFYTVFDSNVETTSIALVFYALNLIIDLFVFFLSYGVVIYGMYRLSLKKISTTFWFAMLSPVFKYILKLIVTPIVDGFISIDQFLMDIYSIGISAVLEILQFLIIIFVTKKYIDKYKSLMEIINKAAARVGDENMPDYSPIPFKKLIDLKNPLQKSAFTTGAIITGIRILMLLINDFSMSSSIVGITNWAVFIGAYVLEIAVGFIGYFFMLYVFINLYSKEK